MLVPSFPNLVSAGTYMTAGYGSPARIIATYTPKDCPSIVYIIDEARRDGRPGAAHCGGKRRRRGLCDALA